jgi:predicted ATPase
MRIAISGSHGTGKSTLIERLAAVLPDHQVIAEPYYALEALGHAFAHPPSLDDFLAQLECSIESLRMARRDVLFDRNAVDFLAYISALDGDHVLDEWLPRVGEAMGTLDLLVFVPIESPDRIAETNSRRLRARVNELLREIILEDSLGLGLRAFEVTGTPEQRAQAVMTLGNRSGETS